jgi:hypothetical protein
MNLPFKVNEREKKVLIIGGILVVLIIGYYVYAWYTDTKKNIQELSDAKVFMLQRQLNKISEKDYIENKLLEVQQTLERQEGTLLSGNTPPVAAAALQKLLKETASSLSIDVKLERTLNAVDAERYLAIPVEIGFTATTGELKDLLVKLRQSPLLLTVSELKVRVTNISRPEDIYTTLVVTGFIKKSVGREGSDREEKKNVT